MARIGQVGEYVDGKKDIASYIERVELHFAANYVKADYKVATYLAMVYRIVRTFMEQALDQQLICSLLLQSYLQKLQ